MAFTEYPESIKAEIGYNAIIVQNWETLIRKTLEKDDKVNTQDTIDKAREAIEVLSTFSLSSH